MSMKRKKVLLCFFLLFTSFASAQEITWGNPIRLSYVGVNETNYRPSMSIDTNDNSHVTWTDVGLQSWYINYIKTDADGRTLVPETRLTPWLDRADNSVTSLDTQGNLHVVWYNSWDYGQLYYQKLNNNGIPLTNRILLVNSNSSYSSMVRGYSMGTDIIQGNVHITWGSADFGIYYMKLNNVGQRIIGPLQIRNMPSDLRQATSPFLAIDSVGNVHITWGDSRAETNYVLETYYTKLDNNGNTLVDDTRITFTPSGHIISPPLTVVDNQTGKVYLLWQRLASNDYKIFYTKLDNNGQRIGPDIQVVASQPGFNLMLASTDVDRQGNIHVGWYSNPTSSYESIVYYKKLDNNGNTLVDDTRVTFYPSLITPNRGSGTLAMSIKADSKGYAHIAWADGRDDRPIGTPNIYYARTYPLIDLTVQGPPCLGSTVDLNLFSYPNDQYALAMSLGNSPGVPLPGGRTLPLNMDPLFFLSLSVPQAVGLEGGTGQFDAQGRAHARWAIPNVREIGGLTFHFAFVSYDPSRGVITSVSPPLGITLPS